MTFISSEAYKFKTTFYYKKLMDNMFYWLNINCRIFTAKFCNSQKDISLKKLNAI